MLAQRLFALVAFLVGGLALALDHRALLCQPFHLARQALTLADLGGKQGGEAPGRGTGRIGDRLQELGVARVSYGPAPQRVSLEALQDLAAMLYSGGVLPDGIRRLN